MALRWVAFRRTRDGEKRERFTESRRVLTAAPRKPETDSRITASLKKKTNVRRLANRPGCGG